MILHILNVILTKINIDSSDFLIHKLFQKKQNKDAIMDAAQAQAAVRNKSVLDSELSYQTLGDQDFAEDNQVQEGFILHISNFILIIKNNAKRRVRR